MSVQSLRLKAPAYHRQRLLLFFLEFAGKSLGKIELQKLILLYTREMQLGHYAFVPFRYGCYSFVCADDLDLLEKQGWVTSDGNRLSLKASLAGEKWAVASAERKAVRSWLKRNPKRGDALIAETYRRYPYYAIFSKTKEHILTPSEMKAVERSLDSVDNKNEIVVFTIGYEGILLEEYLNKLIRNRVVVLCDVRRNPVSRKFGFSGRMLSQVLPKIGIKYVHFPELGIESEKRQNLNSREAYNDLFYEYRQDLPRRTETLALLKQQIDVEKRVALTCFEKDSHLCHRHCITDLLKSEFGYRIEHL
ncbi:MAG: DUF488 domain-containing protein [Deltaproteobacteria bacterium]|nr:DUF488 domain-containing protein [Deltaproteobacteria bacterium]